MNSCRLAVKVIPGAARDEICGWLGETLKVKLSAPPVDGRANDSLVEFLAETLGLPRRAITLMRGKTTRQKLVRIDGLAPAEAKRRLVKPDYRWNAASRRVHERGGDWGRRAPPT